MKALLILIFFFLINNCSFDNKTGIWKDSNNLPKKDNIFKDFRKIDSSPQSFREIFKIDSSFEFKKIVTINPKQWSDIYYSNGNSLDNFVYDNTQEIKFISKKLSRHEINKNILFIDNYLIFSDFKGNLISYSVSGREIFNKYNFYKKEFKNIKKDLNLIADSEVIYVSDNLGFLYAYNYKKNSINWAKKFKISFRSNLKVSSNELYVADQNNNLLIINKKNGNVIQRLPTEKSLYKNNFKNNFALSGKSLFFLNTFGSLYSINTSNYRINWFLNFKDTLSEDLSEIFNSKTVISTEDRLIVLTNSNLFIIDSNSGTFLLKMSLKSKIDPAIYDNYLFLVSDENLLISIDLKTGKILYSKFIEKEIASLLKTKEDNISIDAIKVLNSDLYVFMKKSLIIIYDKKGQIKKNLVLKKKPNSEIIFINRDMLFLDKNNRLVILN